MEFRATSHGMLLASCCTLLLEPLTEESSASAIEDARLLLPTIPLGASDNLSRLLCQREKKGKKNERKKKKTLPGFSPGSFSAEFSPLSLTPLCGLGFLALAAMCATLAVISLSSAERVSSLTTRASCSEGGGGLTRPVLSWRCAMPSCAPQKSPRELEGAFEELIEEGANSHQSAMPVLQRRKKFRL